jgi:hypothetical protein
MFEVYGTITYYTNTFDNHTRQKYIIQKFSSRTNAERYRRLMDDTNPDTDLAIRSVPNFPRRPVVRRIRVASAAH